MLSLTIKGAYLLHWQSGDITSVKPKTRCLSPAFKPLIQLLPDTEDLTRWSVNTRDLWEWVQHTFSQVHRKLQLLIKQNCCFYHYFCTSEILPWVRTLHFFGWSILVYIFPQISCVLLYHCGLLPVLLITFPSNCCVSLNKIDLRSIMVG